MSWLTVREKLMIAAIKKHPQFHAPTLFLDTKKMADGIIGIGNKMGEGWLLTAEMMELQQTGFENIICAQPFGCLPNHICGKGMINKIRTIYPRANITPIDYDPGATRVNQENRIKLMLSVAKERLGQSGGTPRRAAQPRKCRYTAAWRCRPCTCPALRKSCPPTDERCSAEYRRKTSGACAP